MDGVQSSLFGDCQLPTSSNFAVRLQGAAAQRGRRLDSFASRLANRGAGSGAARRLVADNDSSSASEHSEELGILCVLCMKPTADLHRTCVWCKSVAHIDCDSDFDNTGASVYSCITCRNVERSENGTRSTSSERTSWAIAEAGPLRKSADDARRPATSPSHILESIIPTGESEIITVNTRVIDPSSEFSSPATANSTTLSSPTASPFIHADTTPSDTEDYRPPRSIRRSESRQARREDSLFQNLPIREGYCTRSSDGAREPSSGSMRLGIWSEEYSARVDYAPESYTARGSRGGKRTRGSSMAARGQRSLGKPASAYTQAASPERSERGKRGRGGKKGGPGSRGRRNTRNPLSCSNTIPPASNSTMSVRRDREDRESSETIGSVKVRENDENDYMRTAVVTCANDKYMSNVSLCMICGSVGKGAEGTMLCCTSCCQSYHTYCVNMHDKLNATILKRGWRCLSCTICEGCGSGKDESNLLLCDECDVAFHTYCLDPPLNSIPHGSWRCKWCSTCCRCNRQVHIGPDTQGMDGLCETCHSLRNCPKCRKNYQAGELLVKCQHCIRWFHANCENMLTEEQVETAAENAFRCSLCRPSSMLYNSSAVPFDNVMLSKPVAEHLSHALSHSLGYMYTDPSSSYHRSISVDDDDYEEYQPYQPSGRGRGRGGGRGRLLKLGIGGFSARIPRHKLNLPGNEEEGAGDEVMRQGEAVQQKKRMRKPRRPEMEDVYPAAIQEAFFGATAVDGKSLLEQVVDEPILGEFKKESLDIQINKSGCELSEQSADALRSEQEKDMLGEILVDENEMDIDNLDLNLFDLEDDDVDFPDDSTLDDSLNDGFPSTSDLASGISSPSFAFTGDGSMNAMAMMQQHHERQRMMQQQNRVGVVGTVQRSISHTEPTNAEKVNQATERWEEDEPLGENATKAPVLFANVCHKDLKERFPNWPQRAKAINRLWRSLTAEKRQEFVNRARMNRANSTRKRVRRTATSENVEMTAEAISAKIMELSQQRSSAAAQQAQVVQKPPVVNPAPVGMPGVMPPNIHPMQQLPPGMPPTPGGSGTSPTVATQFQVPQSVPVTPSATFPEQHPMEAVFHLDPRDLDAYEQLRQRLLDLQKEQGGHDTELARLRKIKKTLATKRRQLNKGLVDANGAPLPPVELSETETACFDEAVRAIPLRQKQQEVCKNAIKQQQERLRDFEQLHNIGPLRSPSSQATVASGQGISPTFTHPQMLSLSAPQSALQSPSVSMNNFAYPRQYRPPLHMASMGSLVSGMQSPMPLRLEMDQLSQSSGPPTPSSGRPASSASIDMQQAPKSNRGRKRKKPLPEMRSPVLGNVVFATLTSDLEKDVYDTVDSLVQRVCMHIDGIPLMPVGGSRLPSMESESAPKQKRKRQVLKKPPSYDTNEYELMNDRIQTQLKPFPPVLIEPSQAFDRLQKHYGDVTALPERAGHPNYVHPFVGECRLTFMEDYYENVERRMPVNMESMLPPFMEDIYGKDVLRALMQAYDDDTEQADGAYDEACYALSSSAFCASLDMAEICDPCASEQPICSQRRIPLMYNIPERQPPMEPHRSAFLEKSVFQNVKVEVSIETTGNSSMDPQQVMKKLAQLLGTELPTDYQIETPPQTPSPAEQKPDVAQGAREAKTEDSRPCAPRTCRNCDRSIEQAVIQETMSRLGLTPPDEEDSKVSFCSKSCYYKFMAACNIPLSVEHLDQAEQHVDSDTLEKLRQISADSFAKRINQGRTDGGVLDIPPFGFYQSSNGTEPVETKPAVPSLEAAPDAGRCLTERIVRIADLPSFDKKLDDVPKGQYKWKGHGWMICDDQLIQSFDKPQEEIRQKIAALGLHSNERNQVYVVEDARECVFCKMTGDGDKDLCGRLLNVDANEWVHLNCALWSPEVREDESGALVNVEAAIRRATNVTCSECTQTGASLQCYICGNTVHLICGIRAKGCFAKDLNYYCEQHQIRHEMRVDRLEALRKIYVERDENQLLAKIFSHTFQTDMMMRVGNLIFRNIGQLLPEQLKTFHNSEHIFPIGYRISRLFWSPSNPSERIRYDCYIDDNANAPEFRVVFDAREREHEFRDRTPTAAWSRVLCSIQQTREKQSGMLKFFPQQISGEYLFGLLEPAITKMTESLPGIDQLFTYTFKHGGSPLMDVPLAVNPSGCARCEPRFRTLIKRRRPLMTPTPKKQPPQPPAGGFSQEVVSREGRSTRSTRGVRSSFSTLGAVNQETLRYLKASGISEEMLLNSHMRFEPGQLSTRQIYTSYKKLVAEWADKVYLARSKIQGLGLYAKRDISMNEMIIEYKGEVIRSEVSEMREKRYVAQNRGVYMFRVDEEYVIDATMAGGLARYINHSCDPNCSTKILPYNDDKKIIIIANRPISAGEELTYDYQFELEDTTDKIPCLCGAPNCVKWMN